MGNINDILTIANESEDLLDPLPEYHLGMSRDRFIELFAKFNPVKQPVLKLEPRGSDAVQAIVEKIQSESHSEYHIYSGTLWGMRGWLTAVFNDREELAWTIWSSDVYPRALGLIDNDALDLSDQVDKIVCELDESHGGADTETSANYDAWSWRVRNEVWGLAHTYSHERHEINFMRNFPK